jgi:DNA polymerase-3 subunit epsilon
MYAIVDIETTGGHASANGITEIAICIHDGNEVVQRYETLINPGKHIPVYIQALTGISNEMVQQAPTFKEVAYDIYHLLHGQIFVAHNVNFDHSFVKYHLAASGYDLQCNKLCTVRLSRKILPGMPSYSLGKLCHHIGIGRHLNNALKKRYCRLIYTAVLLISCPLHQAFTTFTTIRERWFM